MSWPCNAQEFENPDTGQRPSDYVLRLAESDDLDELDAANALYWQMVLVEHSCECRGHCIATVAPGLRVCVLTVGAHALGYACQQRLIYYLAAFDGLTRERREALVRLCKRVFGVS